MVHTRTCVRMEVLNSLVLDKEQFLYFMERILAVQSNKASCLRSARKSRAGNEAGCPAVLVLRHIQSHHFTWSDK